MDWWGQVREAYAGLMATRWGYNVFGRAVPSAFFLLGLLPGLDFLPDVRATLQEPSPAGLFALLQELLGRLIGVCLVVLFAIRKRPIGRPSSVLGAVVALSSVFYGAWVIFFNALGLRPPPTDPSPLLSGLALWLGLTGACLIALSYVYLGRHMGIFPEVRGLVTRGPYRYLRHPIYTGYLLTAGGSLLLSPSLQALVIFLVAYGLLAWRAALEERALEEVFGDRYRHYRQSTWGIVPLRSMLDLGAAILGRRGLSKTGPAK